jgi:hypothetical protein
MKINLFYKTLEDSCNGDIAGSPYDCEKSSGVFVFERRQENNNDYGI